MKEFLSVKKTKELLELGVDKDQASHYWFKIGEDIYEPHLIRDADIISRYYKEGMALPAFTVSDMLEILTSVIKQGDIHLSYSENTWIINYVEHDKNRRWGTATCDIYNLVDGLFYVLKSILRVDEGNKQKD